MVREFKEISSFATTASGGTPSRERPDYYNGDICWVTTSELRDSYIMDTHEHITPEAIANSSAKLFPANTLLMAMYGATIGRLGILSENAATNQACCAIFPNETVDMKYLFYCLYFDRKSIIEKGCGAGQPNISQNIIKRIEIPFCNIIEQKQIAEALSNVDSLISSLEKLIEKKKAIKQGAMQNLLTGKTRLPGFTSEWESVQVKDIFTITRGYVLPADETMQMSDGEYQYPVYSSQTKDNGLMGYYNKFLYEDAITWTTDGANAGTVHFRKGKFYCTNVCGVLLNEEGYANRCIASMIDLVSKKYVSYVGNPKLMNNVMGSIELTIPELQEQKAIADILSDMDSEIEQLEEKLSKTRLIKQGMMQQLLTGKIRLV